jgi:hypothetical protein
VGLRRLIPTFVASDPPRTDPANNAVGLPDICVRKVEASDDIARQLLLLLINFQFFGYC